MWPNPIVIPTLSLFITHNYFNTLVDKKYFYILNNNCVNLHYFMKLKCRNLQHYIFGGIGWTTIVFYCKLFKLYLILKIILFCIILENRIKYIGATFSLIHTILLKCINI